MTFRDNVFPARRNGHSSGGDALPFGVNGPHVGTNGRERSEQQTILEHAVHSSVGAFVLTDLSGVIEYANDAFSRLTGYSSEEVLGKHTRMFSSGMQDREFYTELWCTILSGATWSGELRNRKKDGTLYWEAMTVSPVVIEGRVVKFIATKMDITKQKTIQQELLEARENANRASALKDAFLGTISHEIRTPMNVILGFADLLEQQYSAVIDPHDKFYFSSIREASQRLLRTLDLMVNVSSAVSGNYQCVFEEHDITEVVERMVHQFTPAAHDKRLFLEFRPTENIVLARIDRYAFEQSLQNLLDNAIRFTHDGGVFVTVQRREHSLCIEIFDTGEGMSQEFLSRVFEPFNQEDIGLSRRYEGVGLGLSLTKRYIELCHGSITVQSEKGKGTRFTVHLPLAA
ncbi:MAG: PAS domain S-box protein [Bacteroidetes bacterium]|nr:PAS domain S-box protein [Bacteroidota bacterium]